MKTIIDPFQETTEVNRSKFIAHLVPIDSFEGLQEEFKRQHPKANHVVYALRYLNQYEQVVENSSDDGEPKGCAGVPSLNVLRGEELVNVAVLIVRYFGGIKLGTGGMARAYAQAVKNVIAQADLIAYVKEVRYTFKSSYAEGDKILYRLRELGITAFEREFGVEGIAWVVKGNEESIEAFRRLYCNL